MFNLLWSPQQIARTLRSIWPNEPDLHVSHETIYAYPSGEGRNALIACLRQGQTTHRPRSCGTESPLQNSQPVVS
jgi:IS30 family transposase